jgi:hypothetical protein
MPGTAAGDAEDVHFAVGEALCLAFGGMTVTRTSLLFSPDPTLRAFNKQATSCSAAPADQAASGNSAHPTCLSAAPEALQTRIVDAALARASSADKSTRCAAAVWLISLVRFCTGTPVVTARLGAAQRVFLELLGDASELTQEVASSGLGAVHDAADEERTRLVHALAGALLGGGLAAKALKQEGLDEASAAGDVREIAEEREQSVYMLAGAPLLASFVVDKAAAPSRFNHGHASLHVLFVHSCKLRALASTGTLRTPMVCEATARLLARLHVSTAIMTYMPSTNRGAMQAAAAAAAASQHIESCARWPPTSASPSSSTSSWTSRTTLPRSRASTLRRPAPHATRRPSHCCARTSRSCSPDCIATRALHAALPAHVRQ